MAYLHTWGRRHAWNPHTIVCPTTIDELQAVVHKAIKSSCKIRPFGALHIFNTLCCTDSINLDMTKLDKILHIDKENKTVKVLAGIKIGKLLQELAKQDLTLPNQGYITSQTIGGAIATATHGSSGHTGTLSSFVLEIELIDANGKFHSFTPESNAHLFSAAVVNLGCLGIIYSITLKCIPLPKLNVRKERTTVASAHLQLADHLSHNDYFQMTVDPYSEELIAWHFKKTEDPPVNRFSYRIRHHLVKAMASLTFDIMPPPYWLLPSYLKFYMLASQMKSCVDYSYLLLSPADEGHYMEEEIAIPIEYLDPALSITRRLIKKFGEQKIRPVVIILVRFANADVYGYLSPTSGRQTAYISLISLANNYSNLFKEFEDSMSLFQGRPHWGKWHNLTKEKAADLYGENYQKFLLAKLELDPNYIFTNPHISNLF